MASVQEEIPTISCFVLCTFVFRTEQNGYIVYSGSRSVSSLQSFDYVFNS